MASKQVLSKTAVFLFRVFIGNRRISNVFHCVFFSGKRRMGVVQQTGFCIWRESMKWTSFSVSIAPLFSRRRQGTAVSFGFSAVEGGRFPAVEG